MRKMICVFILAVVALVLGADSTYTTPTKQVIPATIKDSIITIPMLDTFAWIPKKKWYQVKISAQPWSNPYIFRVNLDTLSGLKMDSVYVEFRAIVRSIATH
jgi:hypothetical protein